MPKGWTWDETLFQGSAPFYVRGRLPYAAGLADRLAEALGLDGRGRLIDVGCGPGVLALALADRFAEIVGVDPDAGMVAEAARRAREAGIDNARWVRLRAEELPAGLGSFRAASFGQSFHWMERERVAAIVFGMLEPGGAFVHVADVKEAPAATGEALPYPAPPFAAMQELVRRYLGPVPRAGQGLLRYGTPSGEAAVLEGAGFVDFERLRVPAGEVLVRTTDDLVARVFSMSGSAPHLFGERRDAFEADLRRVLGEASTSELFAERAPDTEVFTWRKPSP
jgi:SAM-dependent methyltransferase